MPGEKRYGAAVHLVFDLSLTVAKPWLQPPSGIDRVEFAHAFHWRRLPAKDVTFVMRTAWDRLAAIPHESALEILAQVEARIAPGLDHSAHALRDRPLRVMGLHLVGGGLVPLHRRLEGRPDSVFLTVSCATLHKHGALAALRARGCGMAALVHDLIPLTHPDCFPPGEAELHRQRMEGVARFADAAFAVSGAVADEMARWFPAHGLRPPPVEVAHLGLDLPDRAPGAPAPAGDTPYFVMLGSLEPRKNHLLMLEVWRTLARRGGPSPRLLVIGRRPARGHPAVALLERGDFGGLVEDRGRLPDAEAAALLRGARALLFPSLAEGFGIPLAEALALGVPVLASDIPAFREVGGAVPEFLDPLDGPGWRQAVLDYAQPDSPSRAAQLARLAFWRAPRWEDHFARVERVLERVAARER